MVRPTSLISEQILIILPARFWIIRLEASLETSIALVRLVSSTSFHVAHIHFFEADSPLDPGVVDQHIHTASGVENFECRGDFVFVCDIESRFLARSSLGCAGFPPRHKVFRHAGH